MRLKLKLKLISSNLISANYHYSLSSSIYNLLKIASPEFSAELHNNGFQIDGKSYKLFTFALRLKNIKILKDVFCLNDKYIDLYITSPISELFVKNFLIGTFTQKKIEIKANNTLTDLSIEQAELVPEPNFHNKSKFILNSPLVLSTKKMWNGKLSQYFYRYNDDITEIEEKLNNNLANKYQLIYSEEYSGKGLKFEWDEEYIKRKIRERKQIKKKVLILKEMDNPISIIGMQAPFYLTGDTKLIKIGYECGFGEKNSMGFGMAAIV